MTKEIFSIKQNKVIETIEDTPQCGEAFCDGCGDCLYCYGDDDCFSGPYHRWIEYVD